MRKLLLFGNPNVGKSALFSRLTGITVVAANYPGSTVEYTLGYMRYQGERIEVVDVPGTYSLSPTSRAEEVAVEMLAEAREQSDNIYVNILDATNLERNLSLTLQLLELGLPMIVVLNFWDETRHTGISIDVKKLEESLGVPVIATCGASGEGVKDLVDRLSQHRPGVKLSRDQDRWEYMGMIVARCQTLTHRHHTFAERLEDLSINTWSGLPLAVGILVLAFAIIRLIGESLITYILDPFFGSVWLSVVNAAGSLLGPGLLYDILVGQLVDGEVNFLESMGMLTTGVYVPLAMVLPYIIAFYSVLSFMEDSGYMPRLGILMDNFMHRLGIHGLAIIPMLLGLGCNVPGAMGMRVLETRRERFIAATIMAVAIPCMAQSAMIFGLVGQHGLRALLTVFGTLFLVWFVLGVILNRFLKGESPEIFIEIPPYRWPYLGSLRKKIWLRIQTFVREAVPFVLLGVLLVNILYSLGIIEVLGRVFAPLVQGILGLPPEAVGALVVGFLRKDVAVGMLVPLDLTVSQMIVAAVVLTMYFPCIATFTVLLNELGWRDMLKSAGIMFVSTYFVGGLLNLLLSG